MFPRKRDKRDKRDIGCSAGNFSVTVGVTKAKKRDTTKNVTSVTNLAAQGE
jgi:hypothetical protein